MLSSAIRPACTLMFIAASVAVMGRYFHDGFRTAHGAIAAPTLVIAGELDQGTPVAMAQQLAAAIPGAQLEVLAGASHLSAIEQPKTFAAAVQGFLVTI
jgi:pimeloyl-ACP methyl ester carboxylesterase